MSLSKVQELRKNVTIFRDATAPNRHARTTKQNQGSARIRELQLLGSAKNHHPGGTSKEWSGMGVKGWKITVLEASGRGAALACKEGVRSGVRRERGGRAAEDGATAGGSGGEGGGGGGHRRRGRWVRLVKTECLGGVAWY